MNKTKIDWCDSTWNPVTGCLHGCEYCYAERIAERFSGNVAGTETVKRITIDDGRVIWDLNNPIHKTNGKVSPYPCGFVPTFHRYKLDEPQKWKKSRNIFVCSMADLFGEWAPDSWIEEVFNACEKAPQHNYMFLTKNVERYCEYGVPMKKNMWYGTSITKESEVDKFNSLPAFCNIFVSIEPILEDLELSEKHNVIFRQVDWFIVGAETGRRKDKVIPKREWIEQIVEDCREYNIPLFMKSSLADILGEPLIQEFPNGLKRLGETK